MVSLEQVSIWESITSMVHDLGIIYSNVKTFVDGVIKEPVNEFQALPVVFISGLGLISFLVFLIGGFFYGLVTYCRCMNKESYERVFNRIIQFQLFGIAFGIPLIISRITKSSFLVPKETILAFSAAVILATWVLKMFATKNILIYRTQFDPIFIAFLLVCAAGMTNSANLFLTYHTLIYFCSGLIIFYACVNNLSSLDQIYKVLLVFTYSASCSALWGIGEFFDWRPFLWSETSGRLAIISSFGNPNYFSGFMVVVLPIALCLGFYQNEDKKKGFLPSFSSSPVAYYILVFGLIAVTTIFVVGSSNYQHISVRNALTFPPEEIQKIGSINTYGNYDKIVSAIETLKKEKSLRHNQNITLEIEKDGRRGRATVKFMNFSLGLVYLVSFIFFILLPVLFLVHQRLFSICAFSIIFYGMQVSQTRGAILAFFSGVGFFILFASIVWGKKLWTRDLQAPAEDVASVPDEPAGRSNDRSFVYTMTVCGVILAILLMALIPNPLNNYQNLLSRFKSDYTMYQRLMVWHSTILMAASHPFIGVGLGNFKYHYLDYQAKFINEKEFYIPYNGKAIQTHNEYLQVLSENGILGLSIFLLAILVFYYRAFNLFDQLNGNSKVLFIGTMISITGVMMHSVVSFPFHLSFSSTAFVIILGMNFCISKIKYSDRVPDSEIVLTENFPGISGIVVSLFLICTLSYIALKPFISSYYWKQGLVNGMKGSMSDISHHAEFVNSGLTEDKYRQKSLDDAVASFNKAISYMPQDGELYVGRADIYARLALAAKTSGARKEALLNSRANYHLGMENHKDRELYNDLANVLVRLGNDEEAVEVFEKTVWYAPDFMMARNNYALMLYRLAKKYSDDPNKQDLVYKYLSTAAVQMEMIVRYTVSKNQLLNEQLVSSLFSMYQALVELGYRSYEKQMAQDKEKFKDDGEKLKLYNSVYKDLVQRIIKSAEEVTQYWKLAMEKEGNRKYAEESMKLMMNTFYMLSKAMVAENGITMLEKFIDEFEALITDAQRASILQAVGVEYGKMKDYVKSVERLNEAIKYNPNDATIYSDLGVAHGFLNQMEKSLEAFEKAHKLVPDSASIGNNLSLAYFKLGRLKEAMFVAESIKSKATGAELTRVEQLIAELNKYLKK